MKLPRKVEAQLERQGQSPSPPPGGRAGERLRQFQQARDDATQHDDDPGAASPDDTASTPRKKGKKPKKP